MPNKKEGRYQRIYGQIENLIGQTNNPVSKMATINAILHHKMDGFFWTGFYLLQNEELMVSAYQGPLACQFLNKNTGVCWSAIQKKETIIVPDVNEFPDHIACDSRSRSEIAVPLKNKNNEVIGVLDIDSDRLNNFDLTDAEWLERILELMY